MGSVGGAEQQDNDDHCHHCRRDCCSRCVWVLSSMTIQSTPTECRSSRCIGCRAGVPYLRKEVLRLLMVEVVDG